MYRFKPSVSYIHTDISAWKMEATQVKHARDKVLKVILNRIYIFWNMKLGHWVSGSYVSKIHNVFIYNG